MTTVRGSEPKSGRGLLALLDNARAKEGLRAVLWQLVVGGNPALRRRAVKNSLFIADDRP
jgi:hypothetical protein